MQIMAHAMQHVAALPRDTVRGAIREMQDILTTLDDKTAEAGAPVRHIFAPGCYAREMTLPEGYLVVGKLHRHAHLNFITAGKVRVLTEFGSEEFTAPYTFVSEPGTKRVVLVLEDCIWTTVHPTTSTDLAEIEREVIAQEYDDIEINGGT